MEPVDAVLGAELASATSNTTALDRAIGELRDGERTWARTPLATRRDLLRELGDAAWREADSWVQTAARIKGLDPASPLVGEEWLSGPYALLSSASALAETMGALASGHDPLAGYAIGGGTGRADHDRGPPPRDLRPPATDRLPRFGLDAAGRQRRAGPSDRRPGPARPQVHARSRARAGRGEHHLDRAARRPLPAVRREPGRDAEAQPGARSPPAGPRPNLRAIHPPRPRPHRHRRRARGHIPRRASGHRRRAHDRKRRHPRHDRVRPRRRRSRTQGSVRAAARQADHERARRRIARHRRSRTLVRQRPSLPSRARRDDETPQRRPQLHRRANPAPPRRLAAEAPIPRTASPCHR